MNIAVLMGRLTNDPEVRATGDSSLAARFGLAVQRNYKDKDGKYGADFINCIVFGNRADFASKYLKKGTKVAVKGRISTGSYTNRDGNKVYTTDVICDDVEFAEKRDTNNQGQPQAPQQQMPYNAQTAPQNGFDPNTQANYPPQYQNPPQGFSVRQNGNQPPQQSPEWMNIPDDIPEMPFN